MTTPITRTAALLAACLLGLVLVWSVRPSVADEPDSKAFTFHKNVVYGRVGEEDLTINLAVPDNLTGPTPAIVFIHGGAWMSGKKEWHDRMAQWAAQQGYVSATVGYRLAPRSRWPAQINDVKCAIRYLRASAAQWQIDKDRIAAWGFSAGGHLSMLLGTMGPDDGLEGAGGHPDESSKVNAVVSFYGPADLNPDKPGRFEQVGKQAVGTILGKEFLKDPDKASPIRYVDQGDAPMLLVQGTRDRLVPHIQAVDMMEVLNENRVPAEVLFLVGQGHGFRKDPEISDAVRTGLRFIDRQFRPERTVSILTEISRSRRR